MPSLKSLLSINYWKTLVFKLKTFCGVCFFASMLIFAFLILQFLLQTTLKLQPCPMTYVERLIFLILGFLFLSFSMLQHTNFTQRYSSWGCFIISLAGLILSGKHAWLQFSGPGALPQVTAAQLQNVKLASMIKLGVTGTASCATAVWTSFGLSLTTWTFVLFLLFTVLSFWQSRRVFHKD